MILLYRRCGKTHREQHEAAYALLREGLRRLGEDPDGIGIGTDRNGKPFLIGSPLHFNVSHTPGLAVCVVGEVPCGVDVEAADRPIPDRIGDRYLDGARGAEAVRRWTRKESFGKLTGEGLHSGEISCEARFFSPGEPEGFCISVCTFGEAEFEVLFFD